MHSIVDGIQVLLVHPGLVLMLAGCMLWGGGVIAAMLGGPSTNKLDPIDVVSIAGGAWILPVLAVSAASLLIGTLVPVRVVVQVLVLLGVTTATWLAVSRGCRSIVLPRQSAWIGIALLALWLGLSLLRLGFARDIALPQYFDSAWHYGVIRRLIGVASDSAVSFAGVLPGLAYYHFGYHVLLAGLASLFAINVADLMLIAGQIVLAAVPIPLYALVHHSTGSRLAGLLAVLLAGLGWYMPAHAVNWGKYPALFSILALLTAANFLLRAAYAGLHPRQRRKLLALAFAAVAVAILIHTRAAVVFGMSGAAWWCSGIIHRRSPRRTWLPISVVLAALVAVGAILAADPILAQALDPYLGPGILVTGLVAALSLAAARSFHRMGTAALLTVMFLLIGLVVPAPILAVGTLLDRPMVEMLLFVPLSILGAVAFRCLLPYISRRQSRRMAAFGVLALALVVHAYVRYSFQPSSCCTIATSDDLVALDWLERHVPAGIAVAVATSQLRVSSESYPPLEAAADAGAWVSPLAGVPASPFPFDVDFGSPASIALLCQRGARYLYADDSPLSFDDAALRAKPSWYQLRLLVPGASIYEIVACPG